MLYLEKNIRNICLLTQIENQIRQNVHTRCQKFVPPLCGRDHKEKRGRLKIETKIQDHSIKLSSMYFELLIHT